ncbi:MAG: L-threonylcarbamoyladenylate synthase, partial [Thermomicrobiales bacterium]
LTSSVPAGFLPLFDAFWPGPVTFVVPTDRALPAGVLSDDGTIAVRVPNHPLAIEVIEKAGGAVACTSANRSGDLPAIMASDVESTLSNELDFILDGGVAPGGVASTVVSVRPEAITVLREGPVDETALRLAWENYVERR